MICGDFNVEPGSETLRLLEGLRADGTRDRSGVCRHADLALCQAGRFADYMLVSRPLEVVAFDVAYEPEVSDHCPLVLEI